jgi:hypothetical protein
MYINSAACAQKFIEAFLIFRVKLVDFDRPFTQDV